MSAANNPAPAHVTALRQAIQVAECRMDDYLARVGSDAIPEPGSWAAGELEDHSAAVGGDLCDALNSIEPELGARFFQAMFPEVSTYLDPQAIQLLARAAAVDVGPSL